MFKLAVIFALALACDGFTLPSSFMRSTDICLFFLYTRDNPRIPIPLTTDKKVLEESSVVKAKKTIILIHGHGGTVTTSLNPVVKDALITAEDVNVIAVDWSIYASLAYSTAVSTVPVVAKSIENFITMLVEADKAALNNIHIIGFDLGAHIAGHVSRPLNKIARITGLDPSANLWGTNSGRLTLTDAAYVEVLHTDTQRVNSLGLADPIGHVDFYANGGFMQPGCATVDCSHNRAYELFAASLVNPNLVGYPCSTILIMNQNRCSGLPLKMGNNDLVKYGSGVYRINTGRTFPF